MNQEEIMLEGELRRIEERELEERQWEDAMDREQLERENERLRAENERLREAKQWIPCSERLPDVPSADVELRVTGWRGMTNGIARWYVVDECIPDDMVTYWRPIPEPLEVSDD